MSRYSQSIVTEFSHKTIDGSEFFSIKQGENVVLLTKNQILKVFIEKGLQYIKRWKIADGLLKKAHNS